MRNDLCVIDYCNNRCLQCTNPDRPWPAWDNVCDYSYEAIIGRLEKFAAELKQNDSIYLSGGEPTIHPRLKDIICHLRDNFPKQTIKLLTNARRFVYPDFLFEILNAADNMEIDVSFYGPNREIHDAVTRSPGSFQQTSQGLSNLLKYRKGTQVIGTRLVITKLSMPYLSDMLRMILDCYPSIDRAILIFWEIEGQAVKNFEGIRYTYEDLQPYLAGLEDLAGLFKEFRLYHFPLCTLPTDLWPWAWRTLGPEEVGFVQSCRECPARESCLGIPRSYLEYCGEDGFRPRDIDPGLCPSGNPYKPLTVKIP